MASLVLLAACAKGSVDEVDGGNRRIDASGRDLGSPRDLGTDVDMGTPPTCDDDTYPEACAESQDLGEVIPGAEAMVVEGFLPLLSDEDWFQVRFPPAAMGAGGGTVTIDLVGDATTVMTLEGPTCGPRTPCGEGSAGAITSYSFTDDADSSPEQGYQTRDTPWPDTIFIRVHRSGGPADCTPYTLTITR